MTDLSALPWPIQVLGAALVLGGVGFFTAGTLGLLRFPDVRCQVHALAKADNLGLGLLLAGVAVLSVDLRVALLCAAIWVAALLAASMAARCVAEEEASAATAEEASAADVDASDAADDQTPAIAATRPSASAGEPA
ncbi:MAG: monovalent cation/H(+) antiporter subunit G [Micrococcus sp.]|nr:monovalent cation/H(+) antiporter subunit G [Micrococcus sp.]